MTSPRTVARVVGSLFLVSYFSVFVSGALIATTLDPGASLATLAGQDSNVTLGALAEFMNDLALIGIAALLFPLFKRAGEGLGLWYLGIRIAEAALFMVRSVALLALPAVASASIASGGSADIFAADRALLMGIHDGAEILGNAGFVAGSIVFYVLLYRSAIVPRWIAIWGLIATPLLAVVYALEPDIVNDPGPLVVLVLPIVANELFLAFWLLVRGIPADFAEHASSIGGARSSGAA